MIPRRDWLDEGNAFCRHEKAGPEGAGLFTSARSGDLLLAAGFFQHAQGALVGFVSGLLSLLSGGQSFVSLVVGFVGTSLSAGSGVFGSGQASFCFFGQAAAASSQNGSQSQGGQFQSVVHRFPLKVVFPYG